ncbi:MAG: hypothetical protein R3247_12555, partial [Rhodothermales bacterium]|nr:hypothetical protein [Rhodothermales bacterium]
MLAPARRSPSCLACLFGLLLLLGSAPGAAAQSLDLAAGGYGLSLGDSERIRGVRLNVRDARLRHVDGINATVWTPKEPVRGVVHGLALGLPATGARRIDGLALGLFGVGADEAMTGLAVGGVGAGAGGDLTGIVVGGVGGGAGGDLAGLGVGGVGLGAGGDLRG